MSVPLESVLALLERQSAEVIAQALRNILDLSGETDSGLYNLYLSLPGLCCKTLGGDPELATGVTSAWEILYLGAYLLDTVADEGEFVTNRGLIVTLSVSCIPAGRMLLQEHINSEQSIETCNNILKDFDRALLKVCAGQVKDLTEQEPTLEKCWEIASEKTGEIFALAARSGARLCSENPKVISLFSDLGWHLGILVQIGDDVNGLWPQDETRSDLAYGKWTLPVSYAMLVLPPLKQERLKEYLDLAKSDQIFEVAARRMIIEAGALLYLAAEADRHRQSALKALDEANPSTADCQDLLDFINQAMVWLTPNDSTKR
jgi:geranylgeranyl diphosphate synthase, type I